MVRAIQFRRGTKGDHADFIGLPGEITVQTTDNTLSVHNGTDAGGVFLARADLANIDACGVDALFRMFVPNYGNMVSITALPYTAPQNGWVVGYIYASQDSGEVFIDDTLIISSGSWGGTGQNFPFIFPITAGAVVSTNKVTNWIFFAPCGAQ